LGTVSPKPSEKVFLSFQKSRRGGLGLASGLPDGIFSNQHPNSGKFWSALEWEIMENFVVIWNILRPFGIFYDHLVML
jgi:hypothetical protein